MLDALRQHWAQNLTKMRVMQAQQITIALIDHSAGFEASPERVRLADLAEFSADVAAFLRGDGKEVDSKTLDVAVIDGSLGIQTAPLLVAPQLFNDLRALLNSELLDNLDGRRRDVMVRWQKAARQTRQLAYRISAPFLDRPIVVNAESDYHADDADQWVQVERYIRGEIEDLGGATASKAKVRLPNGTMLAVTTERNLLRDEKENRLYKLAMLRIKAEYNVLTRDLRNARLVEFVEYTPQVDEESLARMTRRGTNAWKGVGDATAWVDELRGGRQ